MSYSIDELFKISEHQKRCAVMLFRKKHDPEITEVEIPAEYNGCPVTDINRYCFWDCKYLRRVYIPDIPGGSITINRFAFENCPELRHIRLPKEVRIQTPGFLDCPKLDPQVVMAGLIGNPMDLSEPFGFIPRLEWDDILRPDVFELAVKYDSFKKIGTEMLFKQIVSRGLFSHFEALEKAGKSPSAEETDALIKFSSENGYTEMTAYLLEYKRQKFGFKKGGEFDL